MTEKLVIRKLGNAEKARVPEAQKVRAMKGLGPKVEEKILAGLDKLEAEPEGPTRLRLDEILPTAEELAAAPPPPGEPPEYTALKVRALRGEASPRLFKDLQRLGSKYPSYDEIPYLLGQLYFSKLWVGDGLKSFRRAIALNPAYRAHPYLLRAAVSGLGNDRDSGQVRSFLVREIGAPAGPYLEEVIYGDYRQQVKERAAGLLREIK